MKWRTIGKIFDPASQGDGRWFAQSPHALVFDQYIRIYFSTRETDGTGKYLSHVSFIDMDPALETIVGRPAKPVVALGGLGCFDEHGIFPMSVLRVGDRVYGYTTGWNRKRSVSVDASIGLVISDDGGDTFRRFGDGPILTSSLHEPFLVGDAYVATYEGVFHMWYIYGTKWTRGGAGEEPERVYKIGHATSDDGVAWIKEGRPIVQDRLNPDECQALPTVIRRHGRYHMWFCYREAIDFRKNRDRGYRIGYAHSADLLTWTRADDAAGIERSPWGWDSDMQCYPNVFEAAGRTYLLYNGNEFGRDGFGLAELQD
jgi:hypothetical protein